MDWCWRGDKPLPEPMLTMFFDQLEKCWLQSYAKVIWTKWYGNGKVVPSNDHQAIIQFPYSPGELLFQNAAVEHTVPIWCVSALRDLQDQVLAHVNIRGELEFESGRHIESPPWCWHWTSQTTEKKISSSYNWYQIANISHRCGFDTQDVKYYVSSRKTTGRKK